MANDKTNNPSQFSVGYPRLEKLLDSENFEEFNKVYGKAYDDLSEIAKKKKGLKKSRDAQKAMKAINLMTSLIEELLQLKLRIRAWWDEKQKEKK